MRTDAAAGEREREFFDRRDRPVDFSREIGVANDGSQFRIIGWFGVIMGASTLLLLLPESSTGHAGKIIAIALSTLGIGWVLLWRAARADASARSQAASEPLSGDR